MRGIPSLITDIRKNVFCEVAKMAYAGGDYMNNYENNPTADRLLRTMLRSGTDLCTAVGMLTVTPLRQMNLKVKKGLLKAGYDADICVFDKDINVKTVICRGEIV